MARATIFDSQIEQMRLFGADIAAGFTLVDPEHPNRFSTRRSDPRSSDTMREIAAHEGAKPSDFILTRRWPHGNRTALIRPKTQLSRDRSFGTRTPMLPVDEFGFIDACDALVTQRTDVFLTAQGADCPTVFLYDPVAKIVGIAHCGWKPLVRGIIASVTDAFKKVGSNPAHLLAYIGPGAGDDVYAFGYSDPDTYAVFAVAGREWLLEPKSGYYRPITPDNKRKVARVLNRPETSISDWVFALSALARHDLIAEGVSAINIIESGESTILNPRYHSHRRDDVRNGLAGYSGRGLSYIGLRPQP